MQTTALVCFRTGALFIGLLLSVLLSSCPARPQGRRAQAPQEAGERAANSSQLPVFMVTVKPLELILGKVAGQRATVITMLKAGTGAHTFDPTPADIEAISRARGFFWIGEEYDGWAAEFDSPGNSQILPLLPLEMLIDLADHGEWGSEGAEHDHGHDHAQGHDQKHDEGHDDGHEHEPASLPEDQGGAGDHDESARAEHAHGPADEAVVSDPHFYTDPMLVKALLPKLVARLSELDPAGNADYAGNAETFALELDQLDSELQTLLAPVKGQPVIMFHPSFNYFLRRYGLHYAGVIEPFPGKEPSPKYLQGIVKQVKDSGVKAIFSETLLPAAPAAAIGEAAGVPVVELDPACGNSGRNYSGYADWLRYNANLFLQALR